MLALKTSFYRKVIFLKNKIYVYISNIIYYNNKQNDLMRMKCYYNLIPRCESTTRGVRGHENSLLLIGSNSEVFTTIAVMLE